ncbi:DUF5317 domain-containing protein [Caldisalinibacter kiritimatiensis]|uniref:DUF5317 domain-containing protein n=1 Tax=Caldisalinibacter kiritimatiensis TaxID=1304284 RepID=R1ATP2_9FIRM|nr:DUF5317 domain-containing protein [Caldisalinibacter kiritimatiensis]EOC99991.1 hypothetical protein L21TH_1967 [Caldisalinibacter kiritimatiensis]
MLLESLVGSVVIGFIRGGKLRRLTNIRFKRIWIFLLAIAVQLGIVFLTINEVEFVLKYTKELYIISYALLFIGIISNFKYKSLWVIAIGGALNLFSFIANKGKIPVSVEGLELAGLKEMAELVKQGKMTLYEPITEATKYSFLGDIITVPEPYPFPHILSIGDMVIALGLFIFIQSIMLNEGLDRGGMIRFSYRHRI